MADVGLLAELQRRKVFKVGAAYLVVGWLLIQVAATVGPQLNLPEWAPRLITFLILLGFPIALVMAWVFEATPEGVKLDISRAGSKRMLAAAAAIMALAFGWYFSGGIPGLHKASEHPRLAVLPLANFSPDRNNAFFADGLHDDLLTALSRMKGVDVISRTTMDTFRDSKLRLAEIAKQLGATHVMEGSVRREGDQVRLTVQLIDARNDDHIWAQTYDRTLTNTMTLQSEVAGEVAAALGVVINGKSVSAPPTTVPAAYDLYLKARLALEDGESYKLLDSALILDPAFAQARAQRAIVACSRLWNDDTLRSTLAPQARADIDRARHDAPGLAIVETAEAYYIYYVQHDYPAALAAVDRALQLDPNEIVAIVVRANLLRRLGRGDQAIAMARRGLEIDPGNPNSHALLAEMLNFYGRPRDALKVLDVAIARFPEAQSAQLRLFRMYIMSEVTGIPLDSAAVKALFPDTSWSDYLFEDSPVDVPTAKSLARLQAEPRQWCFEDPCALWLAREAEYLGEREVMHLALDEAGRLYASSGIDVDKRYDRRTGYVLYLALHGDHAKAIEVARQMIEVTREKDAPELVEVSYRVAKALAAVGETGRAVDILEQTLEEPGSSPVNFYNDPYLRRWMRNEPRYQALRKRVESKFEKL